MTRNELLALASRVEAATGVDRLLDYDIANACGRVPANAVQMKGYTLDPGQYTTHGGDATPVQNFTASPDAAASLEKDDWAVAITKDNARVVVVMTKVLRGLVVTVFAKSNDEPLARTAAALRAMAEEAPQ